MSVPTNDRPLFRCMGGRFCQHAPGTCTATRDQVTAPQEPQMSAPDDAGLVATLESCAEDYWGPLACEAAATITRLTRELEEARAREATFRQVLPSVIATAFLDGGRAVRHDRGCGPAVAAAYAKIETANILAPPTGDDDD